MVFKNKIEDFAITPKVEDKIQHLNICDICECKEKEINCTSRHLTHHFENSFWPSIPLELVTFENNSIVHLKRFPNVTISKLILRHNRISKIDDNAFQEIQNLSQLDLSHNQLTSSILLPTVFTLHINDIMVIVKHIIDIWELVTVRIWHGQSSG
ncbi:hypothetical protein KQX54_015985 [Cotesia glomerata]|uniref:Uncharacterized protein n=1 Tax=Cotesia glomerata TaxID=32391 RepID=A0AAV7IFP5_COTGL|nr:hypothetical protein KQX54_015985 [Cotesia glomerata]